MNVIIRLDRVIQNNVIARSPFFLLRAGSGDVAISTFVGYAAGARRAVLLRESLRMTSKRRA